ncbi:DNA starvation/stationary phase protection protein [Aliifodinibius salipaludis]|uniref:DNA starvation/stationary phase protection protein n=1 Tax=Fodinibius salipaludis TaxID=2032627 RepID=A0A2A2GE20_9BACT|nr:Dps family protein [Aliifodinibius salipaludis]PAU95105.1 DNA starvation/stationary phase protection protein [Aliifodinibius salipaludis]
MSDLNNIGLEKAESKELAGKLNELLANYSIFYQNTRGYHWNIKGDDFFELHVKFEELYNDLLVKIDEVAERILTLDHSPNHRYSGYIEKSEIPESSQVSNGKTAVREILEAFKAIITLQREILELSDEAGDEGTNALMSDYIREQEKEVWMYSSYVDDK